MPEISRVGAGAGFSPFTSKSYTEPGCRTVCAPAMADINAATRTVAAAPRFIIF
jgi:hypothetical protein